VGILDPCQVESREFAALLQLVALVFSAQKAWAKQAQDQQLNFRACSPLGQTQAGQQLERQC
tara:strand:- start:258 stop:443 length:186 start_codon:yes stop_codon:yes gene_type:complete